MISRIVILLLIFFLISSDAFSQIRIEFKDSILTIKKDVSILKVNYTLDNLTKKTILVKTVSKVVSYCSLKFRLIKNESDSIHERFGYVILDENYNEIIYDSGISEVDFPICFDFAEFNLHGYQRDYLKLIDKNGELKFKKKRYFVEKLTKINSINILPMNTINGVFYFPIEATFLKNKIYFIQLYYCNFRDKNNPNVLNGLHLFNKIKIILED